MRNVLVTFTKDMKVALGDGLRQVGDAFTTGERDLKTMLDFAESGGKIQRLRKAPGRKCQSTFERSCCYRQSPTGP